MVVYNEQGDGEEEKDEDELEESLPSCCLMLARILQYLECPQYLRKVFFPMHNDLRHCGLLAPLDAPHHYRLEDKAQFR